VRYESNGLDYASALITLAHACVGQKVLNSAHRLDPYEPPTRRPNYNSPFPHGLGGSLWGSSGSPALIPPWRR
jgi:hypothetical protein